MQAHTFPLAALAASILILCQMACAAAPVSGQRQPRLTWSFDLQGDRQGNPHSNVFLRTSGKRILILRDAESKFVVLSRQDYKQHAVPLKAIAACAGWWAGQGEDLYVTCRQGRLTIFIRNLDEEASAPVYTKLKSILLR